MFKFSLSLSNKGQTQQWGPHFWNKSRGREGKKKDDLTCSFVTRPRWKGTGLTVTSFLSLGTPGGMPSLGLAGGQVGSWGSWGGASWWLPPPACGWVEEESLSLLIRDRGCWSSSGWPWKALAGSTGKSMLEFINDNKAQQNGLEKAAQWTISSNQALFFSFLFFLRQHSAVTETSSLISFYFLGGTMSTAIKTSSFFSFFFSFLCSTVLSPKNALFFFFLKTHCLTDTMN